MNKVYVKLFSALNLGDDLFLKILLERYPNTTFTLVANKYYNEVFKEYNNLTVKNDNSTKPRYKILADKVKSLITRNIWPQRYTHNLKKDLETKNIKLFTETNILLSIGGSIFMQPKKLPTYADIEFYQLVNQYYKYTYYLGCNFGPYNDYKYKEEYTDIFSKATDVCFRDKHSYDLFSELKNIRYRPDIVFGLDVVQQPKESNTIGFTIIKPRHGINKSKYIKKYSELIHYYQKLGYKISLFSFCKKQGDEDTIEAIIKLLPTQKNIKRVFYKGDITSFLNSYATVESMYCGRFHSMILSMLYGQNIYPVVYSQKMTNVLSDINYEGGIIKMEDFYKLDLQEAAKQLYLNKYNIDKERELSLGHFEKLDLILKKR